MAIKKQIRIGILIKEFDALKNWELRIIDGILNDPSLNLVLLVNDGRKTEGRKNNFFTKLKKILNSKNTIGRILLTIQKKIESLIFKGFKSVDKLKIVDELLKIETIGLFPKKRGFLDVFSENDAQKIKNYNLDILLRHEFNIIRGAILKSTKNGIWSFHHGDNSINRGGPSGFWEIALKQSSIGVTLQRLTPELDGGLVIDKAFYNIHWSYYKTNQIALEGSVSILFKNIKKLQQGDLNNTTSKTYFHPLYKSPNLYNLTKYTFNFYSKLLTKLLQKVDRKFLKSRYECWTLFIGKGDFLNSTLHRIKPQRLPKNEFWADPFIFEYLDEKYIFFENYEYNKKKGKISCGRIKDNNLVDISDVLIKDYHLSYPFIFNYDDQIFLMPETSSAKRLEIYRCIKFPNEWELFTTAFDGEIVADAFFYDDIDKNKWLFLNKTPDKNVPNDNELFIYKVNSLDLKDLKPHKNNPVIINSKMARNAGPIFQKNSEIYRPSQHCIDGIYGRGLNVNRIKKLTINEYEEENIITVLPHFRKGLISMHHLHQTKNLFVFDAALKKKNSFS